MSDLLTSTWADADASRNRGDGGTEPSAQAGHGYTIRTPDAATKRTIAEYRARENEVHTFADDENSKKRIRTSELSVAVQANTVQSIEDRLAEALSLEQMSKYAEPLTRTLSQTESMKTAEGLASQIKFRSARAREILAAARSRESIVAS